jgi:Ca2+-binding EF-hand superfamily protein
VLAIFLTAAIELMTIFEVTSHTQSELAEAVALEVLSWLLLVAFVLLMFRLRWIADQLTPQHPLLKMTIGWPDGGETSDGSSVDAKGAGDFMPEGKRPSRKYIEAPAPYELRRLIPGLSKMEALFPFFSKSGPAFLVFLVRTMFFLTAFTATIVAQWMLWNRHSAAGILHGVLALLPLFLIIVFAPGRVLPLLVIVTSVEQFKHRSDVTDTITEMKAEQTLHVLRAMSMLLNQATKAKKLTKYLEEGGKLARNPSASWFFGDALSPTKSAPAQAPKEKREVGYGQKHLNKQQIAELKSTFDVFDKNNSGDIDQKEFGLLLGSVGVSVSEKELKNAFEEMDVVRDGCITFDEFVDYMVDRGFCGFSGLEDNPTQMANEIFSILDKDGSGCISPIELRKAIHDFGANLRSEEVDAAMDMFDLDRSGQISKKEFVKAIEMMNTFTSSSTFLLQSPWKGGETSMKSAIDV